MRELQYNRITNKRQVPKLHTFWVSTCCVSKLCSFLSYFFQYFSLKSVLNIKLRTNCKRIIKTKLLY